MTNLKRMALFERAIPVLPVRSIEAAIGYYEKLGFVARHKAEDFAILRRDGIDLHLTRLNDTAWHHRADFARRPVVTGAESFLSGTASCRIQVQDLDGLFGELREAGALSPRSELRDQPWRERDFTVFDPDGNAVSFFERR